MVRLAVAGNEQIWHEKNSLLKVSACGSFVLCALLAGGGHGLHLGDSLLENSIQKCEAPAYFCGRTVARVGGQHCVLFQHVPSIVACPV